MGDGGDNSEITFTFNWIGRHLASPIHGDMRGTRGTFFASFAISFGSLRTLGRTNPPTSSFVTVCNHWLALVIDATVPAFPRLLDGPTSAYRERIRPLTVR